MFLFAALQGIDGTGIGAALAQGLNLAEDDLVVNNFGDLRVGSQFREVESLDLFSLLHLKLEAYDLGFRVGDRLLQAPVCAQVCAPLARRGSGEPGSSLPRIRLQVRDAGQRGLLSTPL